ncbi:MAG: RNA-binding S4 domain-containing protein [Colwellia sp.]|nr:RNA-binding S4 domain-containing protein [Colwellia sp.]
MSSYLEIQLDQQPIELCKLLKIADLVAGGGEAKIVISEGYVLLNGEVEFQKRKKVYHNDVVEFNGEVIQVVINDRLAEQIDVPAVSKSADKNKKSLMNEQPATEITAPRKRKPISF